MNYIWNEKLRTRLCKQSQREQRSILSFCYSWIMRWVSADAELVFHWMASGSVVSSSQMIRKTLKTLHPPISSPPLLPCASSWLHSFKLNGSSRTWLSPERGDALSVNPRLDSFALIWLCEEKQEILAQNAERENRRELRNPRCESIFSLPHVSFPRGSLVNQIYGYIPTYIPKPVLTDESDSAGVIIIHHNGSLPF